MEHYLKYFIKFGNITLFGFMLFKANGSFTKAANILFEIMIPLHTENALQFGGK